MQQQYQCKPIHDNFINSVNELRAKMKLEPITEIIRPCSEQFHLLDISEWQLAGHQQFLDVGTEFGL